MTPEAITIRILKIVSHCAIEWGVDPSQIIDKDRRWVAVEARFAACILAKQLTGATNEFIGRIIGNRDESTIHNAIHKGNCWAQIDNKFAAKLNAARKAATPKA